jgi:hypothetical protein
MNNVKLSIQNGSDNTVSKIFSTLYEAEQILFIEKLICLWKDRGRRDEARKVFCDEGKMGSLLFEEDHGYLYELKVGARFFEKDNRDWMSVCSSSSNDSDFITLWMKRSGKTAFENEKLQIFWRSMKNLVAPSYERMVDYDGFGVVRYRYYTNP